MTIDEIIKKEEEYYKKLILYRQFIRDNRNNYLLLVRTIDEIYKFARSIAPEFFNIDDDLGAKEFYHILIKEVEYLESLISDSHFIITSEPNFIYLEVMPQKPKTNNPEAILDWLVYMARRDYAYTNFWTKKTSIDGLSFENECVDMSKKIASICLENGIKCVIKRINPGFLETARLHDGINFHDICVVTIDNMEYLVDCTYRQFFMLKWNSLERIGIPYLFGAKPGIFMTIFEERMALALNLLKRGWIPFTKNNIKNYFDGFALSFRNGLYYDETGDYSFTTNYNDIDYINFLNGTDSQVNHEGKEVIQKQLKLSQYNR
ncbi:MAG: hypothetical protein OSJ63_06820 [Bacilli bacterium]|nr:hypothetical protein [Bacilli bacterium]